MSNDLNVEIDSKGFDKYVKSFSSRGQRTQKIKGAFVRTLVTGQNKLQETLPKGATSNLANSVYYKLDNNLLDFEAAVGALAEYGLIAAETGRGPGKPPKAEKLKRWARQMLGDENAAYAVAKKIAKEGTERYKNNGPKLVTQFKNDFEKEDVTELIKNINKILQ